MEEIKCFNKYSIGVVQPVIPSKLAEHDNRKNKWEKQKQRERAGLFESRLQDSILNLKEERGL